MGLTTLSRKRIYVTETLTRELHSGDGVDASQHADRMTDASEILREAGTPMVNALNPKKKTRVATWNVQTLYQTGKLAQVVTEYNRSQMAWL